jgi:hypothetical protein
MGFPEPLPDSPWSIGLGFIESFYNLPRRHRKRSIRIGSPSRGLGIGHICQQDM